MDRALTGYLAELSKITFTENELDYMTEDMKSITALMDKVRSFDVQKKPYVQNACSYEDLRADECKDSYTADKITKSAKKTKNNSFVVPKVV